MVPNKFNIVDFGGFDLMAQYGEAIPGIYDKIVDSYWNCVYIMCFGLKFGGIVIAPQYMTPTLLDDHVELNGIISIGTDDTIRLIGIPAPQSVIIPLTANNNGTYQVSEGVDGFNPVLVDVSGSISQTFNVITSEDAVNFGKSNIFGRATVPADSAIIQGSMTSWSATLANFYNAENLIGAYSGITSEGRIGFSTARFFIGRYSNQNNTLIVTIETYSETGEWVEIADYEISPQTSYPVNYFDVVIPENCFGLRWIHKKPPNKTAGNNITFFGISLF